MLPFVQGCNLLQDTVTTWTQRIEDTSTNCKENHVTEQLQYYILKHGCSLLYYRILEGKDQGLPKFGNKKEGRAF